MVDKIELLENIKLAEDLISKGRGISHWEIRKRFLKNYNMKITWSPLAVEQLENNYLI